MAKRKNKIADLIFDSELQKLQRQLKIARLEKQAANQERDKAYLELEQANERIEIFEATHNVQLKKLRRTKGKAAAATAHILCSDWHAEEQIESEITNGLNEFDLTIAAGRIGRLWNKSLMLLEVARKLATIREVIIWLGGDLINNQLHDEAAESNFLGPASAINWVQEQVAKGINAVVESCDLVTVVTNYGNHGRTTKRRRLSTGYDHSWEWLAYNNLANSFSGNKKVAFQICRGYHNFIERHGRTIRYHHGDAIRFGGGVGGVTIPLRKKIAQWNKSRTADLDVLGHFHQFMDDWRFSLNGCVCGYNAYAIEIGAEFQPPTQTFMVTSGEHCKLLNTPIYVD